MRTYTDTQRLDWMGKQCGSNLVSDDAGRWAVSDCGVQPIPQPGGFRETVDIVALVEPHQWKRTIREALDAAMHADND